MSAAGGQGPLAELQPRPLHPRIWFTVSLIVFDAYDGADVGSQVGWYPLVDGLEGGGVEVAVDSAFGLEKHVAEEIGAEDRGADGEEGVEDFTAVGVVFQGELVGAGGGDERVVVVLVFGDPCLNGAGVRVDGAVVEEDLPYFVRNVV